MNSKSKTIPVHLGEMWLEAKVRVLWWGNSAEVWRAPSHVSHKLLRFQFLACALEGRVSKLFLKRTWNPITSVKGNWSTTLYEKTAFNSPVVDASFMLMCLHSWWTPPRRPGGTLQWTWDPLADIPGWTWLPHQNPERRDVSEIPSVNRDWAQTVVCMVSAWLSESGTCAVAHPHLWATQHHGSKTYQRYICHGVDHNSLVLHCVLCDSTEPRFQHMVSIQERLLCPWFHPHLELETNRFELTTTG